MLTAKVKTLSRQKVRFRVRKTGHKRGLVCVNGEVSKHIAFVGG